MELGQLADRAVDLIGPGLVVVVEEGEVDFNGRGRLDGQLLLVVRGQDRLAADHQNPPVCDDRRRRRRT